MKKNNRGNKSGQEVLVGVLQSLDSILTIDILNFERNNKTKSLGL